jgi:hypothetical protein
MRLNKEAIGLVLILVCALPALGGPLRPCVKAVSSPNGNFLVITDAQLESEHENPGWVKQVSLQVFPSEKFLKEDRLPAPATYWANWPLWSVVLDTDDPHRHFLPACPMSLVTDDGEFVILLDVPRVDSVMRIYRRRDHPGDPLREGPDHGVVIKDIALKEIWPAFKPPTEAQTSESPSWFTGGTFDFSPDSRSLIFKARWGDTVRINLSDGSVSRN